MAMKTTNMTDRKEEMEGIKKRNPIAKLLKFFTQKVIRDKKKYKRKEKHVRQDLW